jgi:hypothetical protein
MNAVWPAKAATLVLTIGRTSGGGKLFIVGRKARLSLTCIQGVVRLPVRPVSRGQPGGLPEVRPTGKTRQKCNEKSFRYHASISNVREGRSDGWPQNNCPHLSSGFVADVGIVSSTLRACCYYTCGPAEIQSTGWSVNVYEGGE